MWLLTLLLFGSSIVTLHTLEQDYYWREYTGTIPQDSIIGGKDINKKPVYIGQAYYHGQGFIVVEIFPGIRSVYAPMGRSSLKIDNRVKILCGNQENFVWFPVNATHLHLQLINKKPVVGGHETGGVLYIGRISYEGGAKIGKIPSFNTEDANMFYDYNGIEKGICSYEILLFEQRDNDVDIGKKR